VLPACGLQTRQLRKDLAAPFSHAVGDDDVGVFGCAHQAGGVQRLILLVQNHLGGRPQAVQAAIAIIVAPHLRGVREQDLHDKPPSLAECPRQRGRKV